MYSLHLCLLELGEEAKDRRHCSKGLGYLLSDIRGHLDVFPVSFDEDPTPLLAFLGLSLLHTRMRLVLFCFNLFSKSKTSPP